MYETQGSVVYFVSYDVTNVASIVLCTSALISNNRNWRGEISWLGFPPHVHISRLRFSWSVCLYLHCHLSGICAWIAVRLDRRGIVTCV